MQAVHNLCQYSTFKLKYEAPWKWEIEKKLMEAQKEVLGVFLYKFLFLRNIRELLEYFMFTGFIDFLSFLKNLY